MGVIVSNNIFVLLNLAHTLSLPYKQEYIYLWTKNILYYVYNLLHYIHNIITKSYIIAFIGYGTIIITIYKHFIKYNSNEHWFTMVHYFNLVMDVGILSCQIRFWGLSHSFKRAVNTEEWDFERHLNTERISFTPVSYTHLDVYKRQV